MELEEYKRALTEAIQNMLGGGAFEAISGFLGEVRSAAAGLGDRSERIAGGLDRMDLAEERALLEAQLEAIDGMGEDTWPLGNVLVGVGNFAIGIQNMARSSPINTLGHLVETLKHFGAVQLTAQLGDGVYNALWNLWQAHSNAQWLGQAANDVFAIELPEGVDTSSGPKEDEHAAVMTEIEAAMNGLNEVAPADGRDHSAHLAGQMGVPFEGTDDAGQQGGGQGDRAPAFDWDTVDWGAISAANGNVAKAAGNDDRLAYLAVGGVVLVGPDHPRELVQAVADHPESYNGTIQVRSARLGAGTIRVEGCPDANRDLFERAMATFSRKTVEFR